MNYNFKDIVAKIIYLSEVEFSVQISKSCIEQAKKFDVEVIPFKGVHGHNSSEFLEELSLKPKYFFKNGRRGVIGCFLSHYLLWKECVKTNRPYLILEHDGYFINKLPTNILDSFDDVLKLDDESPYLENYDEKLAAHKSFEVTRYYNANAKDLDLNETGNYMHGTYSYMIKPKGAEKLILWINKNGFLPSDIQMGDKIVDIKVVKPTIARLHPLFKNRVRILSLTRRII
tara:strand:+ start:338 stop:1027 length:690 start_codon:yes stop_codon:yes gene_type:complete